MDTREMYDNISNQIGNLQSEIADMLQSIIKQSGEQHQETVDQLKKLDDRMTAMELLHEQRIIPAIDAAAEKNEMQDDTIEELKAAVQTAQGEIQVLKMAK